MSTWCVVVVSSFGSSCSWMKSSSLRVKVLSLGVSPSPSMEIATAAIAVGSRALLRHDCLRGPLVVSRLATTSALPLALPFLPHRRRAQFVGVLIRGSWGVPFRGCV